MATNFGLANLYNVFVLGNMNMSNTDAEGRVAAGGNVTLSNYGVGAGSLRCRLPVPTLPWSLTAVSTFPAAPMPAATQSSIPPAPSLPIPWATPTAP